MYGKTLTLMGKASSCLFNQSIDSPQVNVPIKWHRIHGGFHIFLGFPIVAGWFIMGKLTQMDDELGVPNGLETSILIRIVSAKFPPI